MSTNPPFPGVTLTRLSADVVAGHDPAVGLTRMDRKVRTTSTWP
ncbi:MULTISPECIES: hypothetical protein [unclassified Streptomyces]